VLKERFPTNNFVFIVMLVVSVLGLTVTNFQTVPDCRVSNHH
jgi:hypothetical protein